MLERAVILRTGRFRDFHLQQFGRDVEFLPDLLQPVGHFGEGQRRAGKIHGHGDQLPPFLPPAAQAGADLAEHIQVHLRHGIKGFQQGDELRGRDDLAVTYQAQQDLAADHRPIRHPELGLAIQGEAVRSQQLVQTSWPGQVEHVVQSAAIAAALGRGTVKIPFGGKHPGIGGDEPLTDVILTAYPGTAYRGGKAQRPGKQRTHPLHIPAEFPLVTALPQQDEFVTAHAVHGRIRQELMDGTAHRRQDSVPSAVTVAVVDVLETVDVQEDDADVGIPLLHVALEGVAVEHAGQLVVIAEEMELAQRIPPPQGGAEEKFHGRQQHPGGIDAIGVQIVHPHEPAQALAVPEREHQQGMDVLTLEHGILFRAGHAQAFQIRDQDGLMGVEVGHPAGDDAHRDIGQKLLLRRDALTAPFKGIADDITGKFKDIGSVRLQILTDGGQHVVDQERQVRILPIQLAGAMVDEVLQGKVFVQLFLQKHVFRDVRGYLRPDLSAVELADAVAQQKVTPDELVVEFPDIAAVLGKLAVGAKRTGVPPPLQDLVTFALQPLGDVELFCQCLVVVEQLVGLHIGDVDQLLQVIQDLFMHVHDVTRKKD